MKLQTIVAAVALIATGAANASLQDGRSGNGSLTFLAFDNVSTGANPAVGSVFIDLGYEINAFDPLLGANLSTVNNKVVWNFNNNTITQNGAVVSANNDFSAFASFVAANGADAKWVVAGTDSLSIAQRVVTTGTPTASNLSQQVSSSTANSAGKFNFMYDNSGVSGAVDNGSYFAPNAGDASYVAKTSNFSTNFQNSMRWATSTANTSNNLWMAIGDGSEVRVGDVTGIVGADTTGLLNGAGTFTLDKAAGTLTWQTASLAVTPAVPEPQGYALALVGLAAIGFIARRRSVK
ncbi:MAG: PEP-CTERM sorting domain-containing protein [Burkholderiales bacterium]|nr:PEP-CTERM sorting domain-containing protein [Burkholderiales bacterium]